jgi:L-Lysine epsilon oxidase N-terminal/L-lysine epsilon oxidase C-terminal domain
LPVPPDTQIVRAMIHPGIGIARVGNSPDEFFIGPQVIDPAPLPPGAHRDARGALKRQAAEFRIYGYNQSGEVVRELTAQSADITWSVHVANRKAVWYQWLLAMDIPEAAKVTPPLRNATVTDRLSLVIDPGRQSITGAGAVPVPCAGQFMGVPVTLGELRTDATGRLLFLGGFGTSASPTGTPIFIPANQDSFINADGWYDDTCDGPVSATVSVGGRIIPVDSAWVVSAPPNYAPHVKSVRTMYDLLLDLYLQAGWVAPSPTISFTRHVYPILRRLTDLQWVNQGYATQFGFNSPHDFEDETYIRRISSKAPPGGYDPNAERRLQILNNFRSADPHGSSTLHWPWIYGDAMGQPPFEGPRHNATLTQSQYFVLQLWAAGEFEADWGDPALVSPATIDEVPVPNQPDMLDRAALEFCIADVFHPGCELTFPMRHLTMYSQPFRIRARHDRVPPQSYGPNLTQAAVTGPNGPLQAQGPGELTRWMGLPWQADTSYCRAGYTPSYDPFLPSFWPARVPNQVLSEPDYATLLDASKPIEVRIQAFHDRSNWNQPLAGLAQTAPDTDAQMTEMVRLFGSMGVIEVRPGPTDVDIFPQTVMVASYGPDVPLAEETSRPDTVAPGIVAAAPALPPRTEAAPASPSPVPPAAETHAVIKERLKTKKLPRGANFKSDEEANNAPRPFRRR